MFLQSPYKFAPLEEGESHSSYVINKAMINNKLKLVFEDIPREDVHVK